MSKYNPPDIVSSTTVAHRRPPLLIWYIAHGLASFMASLTSNAVFFFAGYALHEPAEVQLGMASAGGLVYTLSAILGGRIVDRLGQRRLASYMVLICIPIFFFGAAAVIYRSLLGVFLFLLLLNFSTAPLWPAIESALSCCPGKLRLTKRITLYNINWSVTGFIAGGIVGSLALWLSWAGVFYIAAGLSIIVWIIIVFFSIPQSEFRVGQAEDSPEELERTKAILASRQSKTLLHMAWLSNMLSYVACNAVTAIMPTITISLGIKSYALATALASVWTFTRIIGFLLTTVWTGWHYRIHWIMISYASLAMGTVTLLLSQSVMILILSQILFGIAVALLYSGSLYYAMHLSHGSGSNAGLHEGIIGIGTVIGPGVAAISGPPDSIIPKALAIFVILGIGGGILTIMARRAKGIGSVLTHTQGSSNS